jgi:putative transposase
MAWQDVAPMEERIRFIVEATREGKGVSALCREFGISRKTGYKWLTRYRAWGLAGLHELSRRPRASPTRIPAAVEALVLRERHRHRTWGPKKLQAILATKYGVVPGPAVSTIGNLLKRHGLTRKTRGRRPVSQPDRRTQTAATAPNAVWAADFKGWFRTRDGQRCDPLTLSDGYSRYVLACRLVAGQRHDRVRPVFRQVFRRFGLPAVLRVDNGSPFGSRGVCGLSKLSAWWCQLGIRVEFIAPGHPEQNSVHERMHRTLKAETARPPAATPRAQQARFDRWRREFNTERPHEALGGTRTTRRPRPTPATTRCGASSRQGSCTGGTGSGTSARPCGGCWWASRRSTRAGTPSTLGSSCWGTWTATPPAIWSRLHPGFQRIPSLPRGAKCNRCPWKVLPMSVE